MAPVATDVQESDVDVTKKKKRKKMPGGCHEVVIMRYTRDTGHGVPRPLRYSIDDTSDVLTELPNNTYT